MDGDLDFLNDLFCEIYWKKLSTWTELSADLGTVREGPNFQTFLSRSSSSTTPQISPWSSSGSFLKPPTTLKYQLKYESKSKCLLIVLP